MRVGIVEDHEDTRQLLRYWLEMENHEVEEWSRGEGLIRYLDRNTLHLVLVDLWLPDMDGLTIPKLIRRRHPNAPGNTPPMVAVTAVTAPHVREQVFASGFHEYVVKPIDFDALREVMRRIDSSRA
jgi:DNA-binding response OmpR family regulator